MLTIFASAIALFFSLHTVHSVALEKGNILTSRTSSNNTSFQWGPCDPTIVTDPSFSCGLLEIPIDYHDPSAGKGQLAVVKANATGARRGTFFMNPGGPGESGLQTLGNLSAYLLEITGGYYDVVTWDPRGVGPLSVPGDIYCFDSIDEYNAFWNGTIELRGIEMTGNFTNQSDIDALLSQADMMQKKYDEVGKRCREHSDGKYLKYIGTAATARDLVTLADTLDGPGSPVNFLGFSYGTILGSWFINMFPERVGRVILDGVIDPQFFSSTQLSLSWQNQYKDADKVYTGFVTGCSLAGPQGCVIAKTGQSPMDVDQSIQTILKTAYDAARASPLAPLTSGMLRRT